jgi:hypothetical protein
MKFEFQLDAIDVENLYGMFQSNRGHILIRMSDARAGKLPYVKETMCTDSYIRGCINEMQQLDVLINKMIPHNTFDSTGILKYFIDIYGENIYDENEEYVRHTGPVDSDSD